MSLQGRNSLEETYTDVATTLWGAETIHKDP
jgi:hypothetical protein